MLLIFQCLQMLTIRGRLLPMVMIQRGEMAPTALTMIVTRVELFAPSSTACLCLGCDMCHRMGHRMCNTGTKLLHLHVILTNFLVICF